MTRITEDTQEMVTLRERIRDFIYDATKDEFQTGWTLSAHQTDQIIGMAQASQLAGVVGERDARIAQLEAALKPFAELFELRWAEYPDAPDIAPISLGFATHPVKRAGDLQLSDFHKARAALSPNQGAKL